MEVLCFVLFCSLYGVEKVGSTTTARQKLRADIADLVNNMTPEERQHETNAIQTKLLNLKPYLKGKRMGIYLSRPEQVSTDRIVERMVEDGKTVYIPMLTPVDSIEMVKLSGVADLRELKLNSKGFRAPSVREEREEAVATGGLDMLIIPGFAFTSEGRRLGGQKGFFNQLVMRMRAYFKNCTIVGLAFKHQIVPVIPHFDYPDIKVNIVVSP